MSISKLYLPELEVLVSYLTENGIEEFYNRYARRSDVTIGSTESTEFVRNFIEEYTNNKDAKVI